MNESVKVIQRVKTDSIMIEILEYTALRGIKNPQLAMDLYYAGMSGMKLRQVKITMLGGEALTTEAGLLQYYKGDITYDNKVGGVSGLAKRAFSKVANDENIIRPTFKGRGVVYLEPSFDHYMIIKMEENNLLMDNDMFVCKTGDMELDVKFVNRLSSQMFGNDGFFHTSVKGNGLLVVKLPVPESEMKKVKLNKDQVRVDGHLVLMFDADLEYNFSRSSKSLIRSSYSGDFLLATYKGTGSVYLAPTLRAYEDLRGEGRNADKKNNKDT